MLGLYALVLAAGLTHHHSAAAQSASTSKTPSISLAASSADERFLRAYNAARTGHSSTLSRLKPLVFDHPLYVYVVHADLQRRLPRADDAEVEQFLTRYGDTPLAGQLRTQWLKKLAKRGDWQRVKDHFDGRGSVEMRCTGANARLQLGGDPELFSDVRVLWLAGQSQPDACDGVFNWFSRQGGITAETAWERIKLAQQAGERRLASYLTRYLPASDRRWESRLRSTYVNPARALGDARHWPDSSYARDVALIGLHRLAPADPEKAWQLFTTLRTRLSFNPRQIGEISHRIALMAATDFHPNTLTWMAAIPPDYVDDQIRQWRVRVSLRARDWGSALGFLDQLSSEDQADVRWQYWRARSLDALGRNDQAFLIFEQVARQPNYHGFMASDYLRLPYSLCPLEVSVEPALLQRVSENMAITRALILYRLEMLIEARREWNFGLSGQPADVRRQAAILADQAGWHGRAILTLADTGDWRLYDIRFPTQYRELVDREARRNGLNPAWVYAILRAESAFVADAHSGAGARGLMQLTPTTGREVARRNGLRLSSSKELYDPQRNIPLGAAHLRELLGDFGDNPVLATAAYNAGPTPVKRWLSEHTGGSADLWVETIPYGETRSYVGTVMAFAAVYDWRLDDKIKPLSHKMPAIGGAAPSDDRRVGVVCRAE